MRLPSLRRATRRVAPAGKDKRVLSKVPVVSGALGPPASGGVDHGVATRGSLVGLAELLDPGGHGGRGEAVAAGLEVEHTRQGLAIAGPAAAVGNEVLGLGLAGAGAWLGEVVSAADELGIRGAGVVFAEGRVGVGGALGGLLLLVWSWLQDGKTYLDHDEAGAGGISTRVVDVGLVVGDVEALDGGVGSAGESKERNELHCGRGCYYCCGNSSG